VTKHQQFGLDATKHSALADAAKKLKKSPESETAISVFVGALVDALDVRPRGRGRQVSVRKRVGSLLRLYASDLSDEIHEKIAPRVEAAIQPKIEESLDNDRPLFVGKRKAANLLGISVAEIDEWCRSAKTRKSLGWPRPFGADLRFLRAVLETKTAGEAKRSLPDTEPWPRDEWPDGWLA
jgi:hypothetical protein